MNTEYNKIAEDPPGRVLRLRHHQLLPTSFLLRDVKNRGQSPSALAFLDVLRATLESISECSLRLCFSDGERRSRHIQRLDKVFCDVRFMGLVEEDLWTVRKRFIHQIIVLECFSKVC